jgi:hypothetical protein
MNNKDYWINISDIYIACVCARVNRKEPDVGTMIWELSHVGGEGDGGRCTPCNMIEARSKSDGDTV